MVCVTYFTLLNHLLSRVFIGPATKSLEDFTIVYDSGFRMIVIQWNKGLKFYRDRSEQRWVTLTVKWLMVFPEQTQTLAMLWDRLLQFSDKGPDVTRKSVEKHDTLKTSLLSEPAEPFLWSEDRQSYPSHQSHLLKDWACSSNVKKNENLSPCF